MINVAQCRPVLLLFKGAVEYFQLCDGKDEGFVSGKSNNFRVVLARPVTFQCQIRFTLPFLRRLSRLEDCRPTRDVSSKAKHLTILETQTL